MGGDWASLALLVPLAPAVHALRLFGRLESDTDRSWMVFLAGLAALLPVALGLALSSVIQLMTSYYTATQYKPVQEIAEASETGPATTILSGFSTGLESSVYAILAIVGILIYLWFRFEWQFALGAMVANVHDIVLTIGFYMMVSRFLENLEVEIEPEGQVDQTMNLPPRR